MQLLHAGGASAHGQFSVERGAGWIARFLCAVLRIPRANPRSNVALAIEPQGEAERWIRTFGAHPLRTLQWARGGLLVEGMGLFQCWFRLRVESGALIFEQARATIGGRWLGLPLPRLFAPRVTGRAAPLGERVHVDVRIYAPLAGLLVAYAGTVTVEARA